MIHFRGWRTSACYCKQNAIKVKYEIAKNAVFRCPHCKARIQRRGTKWLTFIDTPINEYDVSLVVEAPRGYCPHCRQHMVLRPAEVHSTRRMTLRLISTIARWMKEASAALVAKQLRLSESTVLRADKDAFAMWKNCCRHAIFGGQSSRSKTKAFGFHFRKKKEACQ